MLLATLGDIAQFNEMMASDLWIRLIPLMHCLTPGRYSGGHRKNHHEDSWWGLEGIILQPLAELKKNPQLASPYVDNDTIHIATLVIETATLMVDCNNCENCNFCGHAITYSVFKIDTLSELKVQTLRDLHVINASVTSGLLQI